MMTENATGRHCVYTACAKQPCNYGTCISQSPTKFRCHCPDGYTGRNCEVTLAVFHKDTGLSFSSMFAICICFLALLGSYGNYILYYLWWTHLSVLSWIVVISSSCWKTNFPNGDFSAFISLPWSQLHQELIFHPCVHILLSESTFVSDGKSLQFYFLHIFTSLLRNCSDA